jgi:hypothetical protein
MAQAPAQDQTALTKIVKDSLQKAQGRIAGLRNTNTVLMFSSIVSSAATALVAGGTAVIGPVAGAGDAGWRIPCLVAAFLAFTSTVTTALIQQMKTGERLMQATQCVGRLRALELAIATGSQSWNEITKEYGEVLKAYPDYIG